MNRQNLASETGVRRTKYAFLALFGALTFVSIGAARGTEPLSASDVTWLFPPPTSASDLALSISIADLQIPGSTSSAIQPVWSDSDFNDFWTIANGPAGQVAGTLNRIALPAEAHDQRNWFVTGIRIDPGAPSLAPNVVDIFGRRPQIRLILQPVVQDQSGIHVKDAAAHLIFDFVLPPSAAEVSACPLHATPNDQQFKLVIDGVVTLRDQLAAGNFGAVIVTAGQPLDIHPGLRDSTTRAKLVAAIKSFLVQNLQNAKLDAMAAMGTPAPQPAPWIFLSMNRPTGPHFMPVPSPTLDGSQFAMGFQPAKSVVPAPHTNNLNPITCLNSAFGRELPPTATRQGVSTADLMATANLAAPTAMQTLDRLANTSQSHFFNTDCVSCHTATRIQVDLNVLVQGIAGTAVQRRLYNVHNLGWSPEGTPSPPSIARRTASETADSVSWINAQLASGQ
jgi:hypothetical protein